jgi:hypothetical protein
VPAWVHDIIEIRFDSLITGSTLGGQISCLSQEFPYIYHISLYPNGVDVKFITHEAWKLEAQIISRMLERISLKVKFDVLTFPEFVRKTYIPGLDRSPEEQDSDMAIGHLHDCYGNTGALFSAVPFLKEGELGWIEHDPVYEEM